MVRTNAINNAVNHAHSSRLEVCLTASTGLIEITVTDNGKGIPKRRKRLGSGIDNMKTRAKLISARFGIYPGADGLGTQIAISLPKMPHLLTRTDVVADGQKDTVE